MKTQKHNIAKNTLIIAAIVIALFFAIPFGFGMYSGIKSHSGITGKITRSITENCNCDSVTLNISAIGLQFSKEDGTTNQKVSYTLENCEYTGTAKQEAARINETLKSTIEGYESLDVIEFIFVAKEGKEHIKIKKGALL